MDWNPFEISNAWKAASVERKTGGPRLLRVVEPNASRNPFMSEPFPARKRRP